MVDSAAEDWVRCAAAEVLGVRFSVSVGDRTATQDGSAHCDLSVRGAAEAWTVRRGCEDVSRFHRLLCGFAQLPEVGPARVELTMPAWLGRRSPTSYAGDGGGTVQEAVSSDTDRLRAENFELRQQLQLARELLCARSVGECSEETRLASSGGWLHHHEHAILDARSSDLLRKDATGDVLLAPNPSDSRRPGEDGGERRAQTGSVRAVSRARRLAAPRGPQGFVADSVLFIDDGSASFGDGRLRFAALVDGKVRTAGLPFGNIPRVSCGDTGSQVLVQAILAETVSFPAHNTDPLATHAADALDRSVVSSNGSVTSSFVGRASSSHARLKSLDELSTVEASVSDSDGYSAVSFPEHGLSDHRSSFKLTTDSAEQNPSMTDSSAFFCGGDTHSPIASAQLTPVDEPGVYFDGATSGSEADSDGVGHLGTELSDDIADLVVNLHSGPKESRGQAAVDLWHTVSWSERATATVASMPWVLEGLCALVTDSSTTSEDGARAAFVLGRLAAASSECKVAVASQSGTLGSIVDLLRSDVFDAQTNAAGLVWSLLGASEEATATIAATPGMLEALAAVLSSGTVRGKSNAAGAFGNIARRSEERKAAVRETYGVLEGLIALLACSDAQANVNAAAALWGLARCSEGSAAAISATPGAVEALARLLESENTEARCNAAGALEVLATPGPVSSS